MALRKKAPPAAAAPAPTAPAPTAPAAAAPAARKKAAPVAAKKVTKSNEKPNWLVARLRNAVAKNFTDEAQRKEFREAAKGASTYEELKAAAGVDDAEWALFLADFFNNGGKAPPA